MASYDSKPFSSSNIISMKQLQLCEDPIWTDRELQFLRDNYNKLTYNELANRLKRSKGAIIRRVEILKLRKSGGRWTTAEVQYLKDNHATTSNDELSQYLHRSDAAIRAKATKYQLRKINSLWTTKDIQYLKENYQTQDIIEIAIQLQHTPDSVRGKALKLGLVKGKRVPKRKWTEEELEYLKENINTQTTGQLAIHLRRHPNSICYKIRELNLRPNQKNWTENEIEFLKKNYITMGLPELAANLNRSQKTIYTKAYQLNITRKRRRWTENEVSYLQKNYLHSSTTELALHLERSEGAIKHKVSDLGFVKEIIHPLCKEDEISYLCEHFGKLSLSELSKKLGHREEDINEKIRELYPTADRSRIFLELLREQVAEFTVDGEKGDTIKQIKKWALSIGRGLCRYNKFKYLRLQSYRLMVKAVIAESYAWVTKKEEIPFEKEWEKIKQRRYALRRIIYKYYDD